jgi:hypothetical protein
MKLPSKEAIKIRKIISGVKPMLLKATLRAPKKMRPTTINNTASKIAKSTKLCWR